MHNFLRVGVITVLIGLSGMVAMGCIYPIKVSAECPSRISGCLSACDGQSKESYYPISNPIDHRSVCEENCQSICH